MQLLVVVELDAARFVQFDLIYVTCCLRYVYLPADSRRISLPVYGANCQLYKLLRDPNDERDERFCPHEVHPILLLFGPLVFLAI